MKAITFLSCHGFQVETTMAASLFLTANINSHEIQYTGAINVRQVVFYIVWFYVTSLNY